MRGIKFFISFILVLLPVFVWAESQDFEGSFSNLTDCPTVLTNTNVSDGNWQWEPLSTHAMCRSSGAGEYKGGSYGLKLTSPQGVYGGPHVRFNGTKPDPSYMAAWFKFEKSNGTTLGTGSGSALKLMGARTASNENELMARDYNANNWRVYMTNNAGGYNYYYLFNSQDSGDPHYMSFDEWHYIKLYFSEAGAFDVWINNVHVPYANTKADGTGSWRSLPVSDYEATASRTIIWWFLNYSGSHAASDITVYVDDLCYDANDPGYPSSSGAPEITVTDSIGSPTDLDVPFGAVEYNTTVDATVTVTNDGDTDLTMGTLSGLAAPFTIQSNTCNDAVIAPDGTCVCVVRFAPTDLSESSDTLVIPSDDGDENPTNVAVSGEGKEPASGEGGVTFSGVGGDF